MIEEIKKLKGILDSILGEPKNDLDSSMELEYPCPRCIEKYGNGETRKNNLSLSLSKNKFQCWKCASEGDTDMKGSVLKIIRMYGNERLLSEYKSIVHSIRESEMYKLHFHDSDFNIEMPAIANDELKLPSSFKRFKQGEPYRKSAIEYLVKRGIGWDIIEKYGIGYTEGEDDLANKKYSYRIIIPSYDHYGELSYWVGRDYIPNSTRIKYANPKVEKKSIIFNEEKIQWDADVNIVEGPFDHIVVPNSIPLLGKSLTMDSKVYWDITTRCNAKCNIFLDADAYQTAKEIYKLLNHGRLYNKVRIVPVEGDEDPSSLYQSGGYRKIAEHLANAQQINEIFL